jgi:hypothetical protein
LLFQQDSVLAELFSYANPDAHPRPRDESAVMATRQYLKACNKIFECGFLDTNPDHKINDVDDSSIIRSIDTGFTFFRDWIDRLRRECMYMSFQCTSGIGCKKSI